MPKYTNEMLANAVNESYSIRQVIIRLGLKPAGGNYENVKNLIYKNSLDISHFTGKAWNQGKRYRQIKPARSLEDILTENSNFQSYKLKKKLFAVGLKKQECEICSWKEMSIDGRIPLELDHINGKHNDNRLINLRILCPNCHSLQATHRGLNKQKR